MEKRGVERVLREEWYIQKNPTNFARSYLLYACPMFYVASENLLKTSVKSILCFSRSSAAALLVPLHHVAFKDLAERSLWKGRWTIGGRNNTVPYVLQFLAKCSMLKLLQWSQSPCFGGIISLSCSYNQVFMLI